MGLYWAGLIIGRILAPQIWGAYFWKSFFYYYFIIFYLFFFFGGGGGGLIIRILFYFIFLLFYFFIIIRILWYFSHESPSSSVVSQECLPMMEGHRFPAYEYYILLTLLPSSKCTILTCPYTVIQGSMCPISLPRRHSFGSSHTPPQRTSAETSCY